MQGMSMKSILKNPSLIPLFTCFGIGLVGSAAYLLRLAVANPDVSWQPKKNPEPWQAYKNKEYKLISIADTNKVDKVKIPEY
ncbi:cytochrome c oxidase subunit NDUFA4 [Fopius arisanus]|uniref:Cytochrome c oxidase subunit NDUFA4 n=1 Tax=Fopius arisanus TaxID=64838 RepID=A0A9R1U359_9HYME|nr:PREDICTED: cytochrome c oxidase subunit NDUFA4 [Fopius arisanus]